MSHITNFTRIVFWLALAGLSGVFLVGAGAYLYLSPKLPAVDALRDVQLQTPMRIYSADQQLMGEFGEKRRSPIGYQDIPPLFTKAILAAEDDSFYQHPGVDIKGLLRAVGQLITTGSIKTGGSTITMQVAKNYFLSHERTFTRKFNEILLALQIERELSKDKILELYLNKIFLGNRAYGIEAAAQVYYGKPISELTVAQLAMIAGLPKAPSAYNPLVNPSRALIRRDWILGRMNELGYIGDRQYQQAVESPVTAIFHGAKLSLNAPYVSELARKEMLDRYGSSIYAAGYKVYTTVNSKLQSSAQKAVLDGLMAYDQRHGYRGPEANFAIDDESLDKELRHQQWLLTLTNQRSYGGLLPAIVTDIEEQAFSALLPNGDIVKVGWEDGLSETRRYITVNSRQGRAKSAAEIVSIGDLVRLKPLAEQRWALSQLPAAQAALVSLDANNGAILSLVGGFDYQQSKFNRVTQAARQPGSNFKPFIYTAALAQGFTPASIINDAPIVFEDESLENTWRPTNSSGRFFGPTRLRQALFKSRNLVSIRLLRELGISNAINYIERFGFNSAELPKDLSLALGSHSLEPIRVVSAYSSLANGGYRIEPYLIDRIEALDGSLLFQANPATACHDCDSEELAVAIEPKAEPLEEASSLEELLQESSSGNDEFGSMEEIMGQAIEPIAAEQIIEPRVAFLIDSMLKDVVKKGTGRKAMVLGRSDLAGKTGTTNGPTDAWFSGYGGGIVTTAWLGFDKNELLGRREYGGSAALPIWIDYMRVALKGHPESIRKQPEGIISVRIDPTTGQLAKPGQRDAIFEYFREEFVPEQVAEGELLDLNEAGPNEVLEEDIF